LHGIWACMHHGAHGLIQILNTRQKSVFIEKSVINGYIKAFSVGGKESV
jgi:hypothetical protein